MARLIDADALLKDINDYPYGYRGMIKDTIAKQPTIEPKHGHWIAHGKAFMGATIEACSECGELLCGYNKAYCPNCGAKMDEVRNE